MFTHHEQLYADKLKPSTSAHSNHQLPQQLNQQQQLDAVIIRNLTYEVGRGNGKRIILNKINLTVPEGSIYGLLGPSGCGKTTMLRCVVGRIRARSGSVLVFGFRPGDGHSEVPGRDVGYMPQEISIYEDFTIEETLRYFGKINRLRGSEIKKRIEFLLQFLDLPSKKRLVVNLSGGQKRRVSLAAALVHSPPLLILDEPTVGVDPLLRQSIWQHLVTLTKTERISVIITTHYIEEARQANVVGLMRHGKILAENSPDELMHQHQLTNLEDVFLKLCVTDSSRRAATLATAGNKNYRQQLLNGDFDREQQADFNLRQRSGGRGAATEGNNDEDGALRSSKNYHHRWDALSKSQRRELMMAKSNVLAQSSSSTYRNFETNLFTRSTLNSGSHHDDSGRRRRLGGVRVVVPNNRAANNGIELNQVGRGYVNEAVEMFSSEDDDSSERSTTTTTGNQEAETSSGEQVAVVPKQPNYRQLIKHAGQQAYNHQPNQSIDDSMLELHSEEYLAMQAINWAARRSNALNLTNLRLNHHRTSGYGSTNYGELTGRRQANDGGGLGQWWTTLMAVTWKNYIRLRRNPPVLVFQFMLPAIQVILFCLCIGGEPFDVPVAIVNDEAVPRSSLQFLNGLNKKIIRQIKYDNLTSAMEAVRRGSVWGAIHIPDKYSENLQSRLIMGEEVTNDTISNGTIRVYPDLTNLHLAIALETTFRETFMNFARNSLEEMGYNRSLADLPIQVAKPVYGTMKKDGYLEFMAPGVVISISYIMATGLTALAFILERRDGLLERSLVSGVQTSQILLAHAINQVVVMVIQIFLVLGCTFFVFEIPSRGPFFWVVLLILLQGCTGMGFGLLVSAVCKEENTAVMMLVGTFYTNLILAGIIWPIEAMPHWLRPLSYAQPQTLPTDSLRHILSRGWGITEGGVLLGFAVTIGWLVIFLMAAGIIFKYSR